MTTSNGRIATVHAIERMVARLRLTREERADLIEQVTGERSLVKVNGYQLADVRRALEERLQANAAKGQRIGDAIRDAGTRMRPDGSRFS
ncbi:MAG: hypothetical protein F4Y03_09445 [Alphaproteobacteria bacterium]|nr:hypothetical protein [Alphaproteobacteria bacterium]